MQSLQELAHQRPITNVEQFLEQVAWSGARLSIVRDCGSFTAQTPQQVRPDEATPLEPTPAQVEPVPTNPPSPVADPSSSKLEAAPSSSPIIIISEDSIESASG